MYIIHKKKDSNDIMITTAVESYLPGESKDQYLKRILDRAEFCNSKLLKENFLGFADEVPSTREFRGIWIYEAGKIKECPIKKAKLKKPTSRKNKNETV